MCLKMAQQEMVRRPAGVLKRAESQAQPQGWALGQA